MFALSYDLIDIFNIVCLVLYLLSIFSNSFIVYEDRIVYFIVITNGLLMAYQATKTNKKLVLFIMLYFACIRLSSFTIRYRTHGTHHMETVQDSELDLISRYGMYALPALLPLIALSIYDSRSKWIVWIYYPIQLSLIFSFWYARDSTLSTVSEEQPAYLVNLPRVVYAIGIAAVLYVLLRREANRWYIHLFAITYAPLLMLKGLNYSSTFALMFTQTILLAYIVNNLKIGTITTVWHWWWLGLQYFFALGQQNTVNTIQWTSGFVGIERAHLILSGVLVVACTLAPKILYSLSLPWITSSNINRGIFMYVMLHAATIFVDMICVTIHRRHLMVWAIFAPKFIFDLLSLAVLCAVIMTLRLIMN
jgi:hypothetical protein